MRPPLFGGPQKHSSSNLLPFCGSKKGTICAVRECGVLRTIAANLGSEPVMDHHTKRHSKPECLFVIEQEYFTNTARKKIVVSYAIHL